ncbi:hypothetical protein TNCV_3689951 [Trichonephila clavipes]|uniref:Uncharacterized protein n=1 Tax=Trichonephila clavipes TaxID=2585209 RepID=A0A8X6SNC4_TRICX|nr:hypothetical protein TNCV_3689951 [Trichonephila clavipes]
MATGSYLTPTYSRSQSEVQGDLHNIVGYNHYLTPRHRIKETLDVTLGYSNPCDFHILPKLIWCSSRWCIKSQSLCNLGAHVFDWR